MTKSTKADVLPLPEPPLALAAARAMVARQQMLDETKTDLAAPAAKAAGA